MREPAGAGDARRPAHGLPARHALPTGGRPGSSDPGASRPCLRCVRAGHGRCTHRQRGMHVYIGLGTLLLIIILIIIFA